MLALTVQAAPAQLRLKRLTDPDGSGPSGIWEPPPPMLRPPQVRFLITTLEALRLSPQIPPAALRVKSRIVGVTTPVVVVVVDVVVVVVGGPVTVVVVDVVVVVVVGPVVVVVDVVEAVVVVVDDMVVVVVVVVVVEDDVDAVVVVVVTLPTQAAG